MNIENDRQRFLLEELHEYEKNTEMSRQERDALHRWVMDGNSVHENTALAEDGHGNYLDFLDVYREEMEISDKLASLDSEEQEEYIASLQGQDTMKSLRRKFDELFYKAGVYEKVLMKHHLLDEAVELMEEGRRISAEFQASIQDMELPELEGGSLW